jgi:TetR/AcrR family transcriptional repressor of nem operon
LIYSTVYSDAILKSFFPIGGCPILNTATDADDTHPELKKKAKEAVMDWKNRIIDLIRRGVKSKEFKSSVNAEETALTIIAIIEGAIMISKVTGKSSYLKTITYSITKIINDL